MNNFHASTAAGNHNLSANPASMVNAAAAAGNNGIHGPIHAGGQGGGGGGAPSLNARNVPASQTPPQLPTVYGSGLDTPRQAQDMDTARKT